MSEKDVPTSVPQAELEILVTCEKQSKGLMMIPVGGSLNPLIRHLAFEKLLLADELRMLDVNTVVPNPAKPKETLSMRIFRMTAEGRKRLAMLRVSVT